MTDVPPLVDGPKRSEAPWLTAAVALLLAGAALNLWYLINHCPLDLAGDEAHYWEWSRRLDWSYYSKGPLVAWIIATGRYFFADWSMRMVGSEMLAVRLPAILLSFGSGLGLYFLARNAFRSPAVGFGTLLIAATVPIMAAGSFLMTIDAPLMFCWVWALVCFERGLRGGGLRPWILAGLLIALGILAKYTMVLIGAVLLLAILITPAARRTLLRPGPYVAGAIGLFGFVPILVWNAKNGWVSVRHVAGQAGITAGDGFNPAGLFEYLGGQALVLNPIWFFAILAALWEWMRRGAAQEAERHDATGVRLLIAGALVPWGVFLLFSVVTKVQPNWPAPAYVAAIPLLAAWAGRRLRAAPRIRRRTLGVLGTGAVFGLLCVTIAHRTELLSPVFRLLAENFAPPWSLTPAADYDPTSRLRGWSKLAQIDELLAAERKAGRDPIVFADDYQLASEIAFYCPSHPVVYCIQAALGQRLSQYDLWKNPIRDAAEFIGRPVIYVGQLKPELTGDEKHAAALPGLEKIATIEHSVNGLCYQLWSVFRCDSFAGFKRIGPPNRY